MEKLEDYKNNYDSRKRKCLIIEAFSKRKKLHLT